MDVLVQGALTSSLIALVALGFSLVYGVGGIVNLAHGSFFMIGAYGAYEIDSLGAPVLAAAAGGVLCAMVSGVLLERLVIAPIRQQGVALLIATIAVAILVQSLVAFLFSTQEKQLPAIVGTNKATELLGVPLQQSRLFAGIAAAILVAVVLVFLRVSPAGRMVRAVSQDAEAARLVGIRPERVTLYVLAIGAGLAGLAGILTAPYTVVTPTMWLLPLTQAFAIVILGGLGSIEGTVLAAFVVGYADRFVAFTFKDGEIKAGLVTVAVILITLVVRPSGLLGKPVTA